MGAKGEAMSYEQGYRHYCEICRVHWYDADGGCQCEICEACGVKFLDGWGGWHGVCEDCGTEGENEY